MESFPTLYTARFIMRNLIVDDIPDLLKHANNKKIADRILNLPHPYQEPDAVFRISYVFQGFKNKTRFIFAIIERESGQFIGEAGLHLDTNKKIAQLSYWIGESFWNQGAATEAVSVILQFGLNTLHLDLIFAECQISNTASEKVMIKTGMHKKGTNGNVVQYVMKR